MSALRKIAPFAFALAMGCSGGGGGGSSPEGPLVGIWQISSGPLFDGVFGVPGFLALDESGHGELFLRRPSLLLSCPDLVWTVHPGQMVSIDLAVSSQNLTSSPNLFRYRREGANLILVDAAGRESILASTSAVPPDWSCGTATPGALVELARQPAYGGYLVPDGAVLRYTDVLGRFMGFDPATGSTSDEITFGATTSFIPFAAHGGAYWARNPFNDAQVEKRQPGGTLVDSVDVTADLGFAPGSYLGEEAAFDGTNLFLVVRDAGDSYRNKLIVANAVPEPDELVSSVVFDEYASDVTFLGPELWGLVSQEGPVLYRIDPATGTVLATVEVEIYDGYVTGFAMLGTTLYAVGTDYSSRGFVVPLTMQ